MNVNPWLLPDGFEDFLPQRAAALERLRRRLVDLMATWGYRLLYPPMIEHVETLLSGVGEDLREDTIQFVDRHSGRLIGLRADMTPQVARVDAHRYHDINPNRLCYAGNVLHAEPKKHGGSRSPFQVGAELFGSESLAADVEIACLLRAALEQAGVHSPIMSVGHVGVVRHLMARLDVSDEVAGQLLRALQRKSLTDLRTVFDGITGKEKEKQQMEALLDLRGGPEVLTEALQVFHDVSDPARQALDRLRGFVESIGSFPIYVDLAELRGYQYHTGLVFSAYAEGYGDALALGGRYDGAGAIIGKSRPAVGFSLDLKALLPLAEDEHPIQEDWIWAPYVVDDSELEQEIVRLRGEGRCVVRALQEDEQPCQQCRVILQKSEGVWSAKERI